VTSQQAGAGARVEWFPVDLGSGIIAGFSARPGGHSTGDWSGLNLGGHVGDEPDRVLANRHELADRLGRPIAFMHQVHGTDVLVVEGGSPPGSVEAASRAVGGHDALVSAEPGVAVAAMVADCVPVLIGDPVGRVVTAVHAGRPGLLSGVLQRAIDVLILLGASVENMQVVLGPSAGPCCYEVPEAMCEAGAALLSSTRARTRAGTPSMDLRAGCEQVIRGLGVRQVSRYGGCTIDDPLWYSYRRQGRTGRFAGVVGLI
jgi:hypothetical protein